jgi:transaldolase
MGIYLDSADPSELLRAKTLGLLAGVTTNPTLVSKTPRFDLLPRASLFETLCNESPGLVFAQLTSTDVVSREKEAERLLSISPKIAIVIPATTENLGLVSKLTRQGSTVGVTALFEPAQCYLACQAGARYVIPYINRSTRLLGDGIALLRTFRQVIDASATNTEIIASSLKSAAEAVSAVISGAHHISVPFELLIAMGEHMYSQQAIIEFQSAPKPKTLDRLPQQVVAFQKLDLSHLKKNDSSDRIKAVDPNSDKKK